MPSRLHRPSTLAAVPLGLALLAVAACAAPPPEIPGRSSSPRAVSARRGDFAREMDLSGELQAVRSTNISAPQTSVFQMRIQFMAEEGSMVRAGDPLLDFDNSVLSDGFLDLEAQVLDAESQILARRSELESQMKDLEIELAEKEYEDERARILADIEEGIVSRKEYGERRLVWEKAARELEETRTKITKTQEQGKADLEVLGINRDKLHKDLRTTQRDLDLLAIKAPSDGLVLYERRERSTIRFQVGDSCWPGQLIIQLPDLSEMQVLFHVSEVDAQHLEVGMPVDIRLDSLPDRALTGVVRQIPSMAVAMSPESQVRIFKVISSLSETLPGEMKPGMAVRGKVVTERLPDVPLVSRESVVFTSSGPAMIRPGTSRDGGPALTPIHPVARDSRWYVLDEEKDAPLIAELGLGTTAEKSVGRLPDGGAGAEAVSPTLVGRAAPGVVAP